MTMKKTFLFFTLLLLASVIGPSSCSYHNDDNPNEYPDPQPEPEPEPEPQPEDPEPTKEELLLTEIRDLLKEKK